jgi:hypothetical protein
VIKVLKVKIAINHIGLHQQKEISKNKRIDGELDCIGDLYGDLVCISPFSVASEPG